MCAMHLHSLCLLQTMLHMCCGTGRHRQSPDVCCDYLPSSNNLHVQQTSPSHWSKFLAASLLGAEHGALQSQHLPPLSPVVDICTPFLAKAHAYIYTVMLVFLLITLSNPSLTYSSARCMSCTATCHVGQCTTA